ncbi:hypothetical protein [Prosthecobacter sp.]|uniref:hypothetical protein n=1 Tax=Prosthecobacter sp. TaxID=1965333 RepID=UPI003784B705
MYYLSPDAMLAQLEAGFKANSLRLKAVENDLRSKLQSGREFGASHAATADFNHPWNDVEKSLGHIQHLAAETDLAYTGKPAQADIERALQSWKALQEEIARLEKTLSELRDEAASLDVSSRRAWNTLAQSLEGDLQILLACSRTLRIRLDLLDGRSQEEVDEFLRFVLAELREQPLPKGVDASTYELDYLKSAIETAHEKHESLGFPTIIKTLFTWYEKPEERVARTLQVPVD